MRSIALVLASGTFVSAASAINLAQTNREGHVDVVHNSSIPITYSDYLLNDGAVGVGLQQASASYVGVASIDANIDTPGALGTKVFTFHSYATGYNAAYGDADLSYTHYTTKSYFDDLTGPVYYQLRYKVVAAPHPATIVQGLISIDGNTIVNNSLSGLYEGVFNGVFTSHLTDSPLAPLTLRHDSRCYAEYGIATSSSIEMWTTLTISASPNAVPEPGTCAALGLGVVALVRRRKTA